MSRTIARQAYPAVLAGTLLLSFGVSQAHAASAVVKELRVGEHPGATRVVLDISQRTNAKFDVSPDGRTLFVVLPDADWRAGPFAAKHAKGMLTDFRQTATASGVELSLLLDTPVRMKPPFFVSPESGYGERIVVDLVPDPTLARSAAPAAQGLQPGVQYARADEANMLPPSDVAVERPSAVQAAKAAPAVQPARLEVAQNYALSPNRSSAAAMPPMQAQAPTQSQAPMPANTQPAMSDRMGGGFLYVKLGAGMGTVEEATADGSGNTADVETEFGWLVNGGVGVDLKNGFRLEGEMLYATNNAKTITGTVTGTAVNSAAEGDTSLLGFMANAAYDFQTPYAITPFVFGGLGLGIVSLNNIHGTGGGSYDSSDTVFAMQAGAGVSTDLSPNLALEASYRYFETTDPELTDSNGGPFTYEYMSHMFMMGMRYKF